MKRWHWFWFIFCAGFGAYDMHTGHYAFAYFMALAAVYHIIQDFKQ